MYRFHIALHARPAQLAAGPTVELANGPWPTLSVIPSLLSAPFPVTFEQAVERLQRLPRMFVEPDGSFVWVSPAAEHAWQVDGSLFDRHEHLLYVELKGACPQDAFDRLLGAVGWPQAEVIVQLMRQAVFLDEATFRRFADIP